MASEPHLRRGPGDLGPRGLRPGPMNLQRPSFLRATATCASRTSCSSGATISSSAVTRRRCTSSTPRPGPTRAFAPT
eukprot:11546509-Alexandrium_andersonii.AAC.1